MIRKFIFLFLFLLIAAGIIFLIYQDTGYVLITYHHWSIETNLWVAALILFVAFILIYILLRLFHFITHIKINFQHWRAQHNYEKSAELTHLGLCEMFEGNFSKAENHFVKAASEKNLAFINYTFAIQTAQAQKAYERGNYYFTELLACSNQAEVPIYLKQAEWLLENHQWPQALLVLQNLYARIPDHPYLLKLLKQTYYALNDLEALNNILPELRKQKVIGDKEWELIEEKIYAGLLMQAAQNSSPENLIKIWDDVPKAFRQKSSLLYIYLQCLGEKNQGDLAAELIENALKKQWDSSLVLCYGQTQGFDIHKQISTAQNWLKKYPDDADLLLCLGRLSVRAQLWKQAQNYFEESIKHKSQPASYFELARVLEVLGNQSAALECYRKATGK